MESMTKIRQMMAEQKFFEAQKLIEAQLTIQSEARFELLRLYTESLTAQQKELPATIKIELAEYELQNRGYDLVLDLLNTVPAAERRREFIKIKKMLVTALDQKGRINQVHQQLSELLIYQFEHQNPHIPSWVVNTIDKYFKQDFGLKLKELALTVLVKDWGRAELLTKELIYSCVEKSSPKQIKTKYMAIGDILRSEELAGSLQILRSFCYLSAQGIQEKGDYKKIIEMVIYFDEFRLQALLLNLLYCLGLEEMTKIYAAVVRTHTEYSFVYFDKYFPQLKKYFIKTSSTITSKEMNPPSLIGHEDKLQSRQAVDIVRPEIEVGEDLEEHQFFHLFKYQDYSSGQLCDLAVSFLQLEMPRVALKAADQAITKASDAEQFLKGCYLKLTSLLQLKDYRAALDTCLMALNKATSKNDILSFLYGQAEVLIRLNKLTEARQILTQILAIDSQYRMAKERLDKL